MNILTRSKATYYLCNACKYEIDFWAKESVVKNNSSHACIEKTKKLKYFCMCSCFALLFIKEDKICADGNTCVWKSLIFGKKIWMPILEMKLHLLLVFYPNRFFINSFLCLWKISYSNRPKTYKFLPRTFFDVFDKYTSSKEFFQFQKLWLPFIGTKYYCFLLG